VAPASGGWAVSGVLDWEFAFAGSPLLDVGLFLRSERVWHPTYREGFEAGYREAGGQLPADWRELALLLDLLSLCSLLDNLGGLTNVVHDVRTLVAETIDILHGS
jgi:aminoglycoside phosphotransferase (APT) family kinase protein